jgi:hypothetical protein
MTTKPLATAELAQQPAKPDADPFRAVTGSGNVAFSTDLLKRTLACIRTTDDQQSAIIATAAALGAFSPADEIEAMIASQAIAAHHASMDMFRRAMIDGQPVDIATRYRRDAANLARCTTDMIEALARKTRAGHVTNRTR